MANHLKTTSTEELVRGLRREKVNVLMPMPPPRSKAAFTIPGSLQPLVRNLNIEDSRERKTWENLIESVCRIGDVLEHLGKNEQVVDNILDLIWMNDGRSIQQRLGTGIVDIETLASSRERCVNSRIAAPVQD